MLFKVSLTLLLVVAPCFLKCVSEGRPNRHTRCKMPKNLCHLRKELIRPASLRDSFSLDLVHGKNITNVSAEYINTNYYVSSGSKTCQRSSKEVCPVYYVLNVDENRIPNSFLEAVCSCSEPQDFSKNTRLECRTKYYYTKVLRRTGCDDHGTFIYEAVWEPVRIGCVTMFGEVRKVNLPPVSPP